MTDEIMQEYDAEPTEEEQIQAGLEWAMDRFAEASVAYDNLYEERTAKTGPLYAQIRPIEDAYRERFKALEIIQTIQFPSKSGSPNTKNGINAVGPSSVKTSLYCFMSRVLSAWILYSLMVIPQSQVYNG